MSTYVLPQVLVFQEFDIVPAVDVRDLNAFICGGHAHLSRYSDADEKALAYIGTYDNLVDTAYSWPGKPAGSKIDTTYTRLYIDNALLRYYSDQSDSIVKTAANKIQSTINFIDNPVDPVTYPRNAAAFYDRDVAIGDVVKVVGSTGSATKTLVTYVKGFEAGQTASTVDTTPSADANNAATVALAAAVVTETGTVSNCVAASADAAAYNGLVLGDVLETYTVRVIQASIGEDATTARLRVISASGNDDVAVVIPSAFGAATDIGTRGLTATFTNNSDHLCSSAAVEDGLPPTDFVVGQEWTIAITQAHTASIATGGGTYTGTVDRTYIVTVTRGGLWAQIPQITCTTDDGGDFSGPTNITAAATPFAVGTLGVTISFSQLGLCDGDRYYIDVVAAKDGNYNIMVLGHSLDADIPLADAATAQLELYLYIKKNIELGEERTWSSPNVNWSQTDTQFTVELGAQVYDSTWTDSGVPMLLPIIADTDIPETNKMYLHYRAWRSELAADVGTIDDVADINTYISGPLHPDNELKWGVYKALTNANGQDVVFMAVTDPATPTTWVTALDAIENRDDVYGLVPLTRDATVLGLFQAHVSAQSNEVAGRWRVLWVNLEDVPTKAIVDATLTSDAEIAKCVISDDGATAGTQYTILRITTANADLISLGVVPGDTVRTDYTTDGFGNVDYSEFQIDAVISEDTVRLTTDHGAAVSTAQKIEIWRTLSKTSRASEIGDNAGAWGSSRVRAVWPDRVWTGGVEQNGYHLCAALAGLSSGIVPQQSMSRLAVAGFDDLTRSYVLFNRSQLDVMAGKGVWIVTQDPQSGEVHTRHAVTTGDTSDINAREEVVVRNVDSISYHFGTRFAPYIGISNATPNMLDVIEAETKSAIQFLRSSNYTQRLGGQLVDAEISDLRISPIFRDRIILALNLTIPYPCNNIEVHLLV